MCNEIEQVQKEQIKKHEEPCGCGCLGFNDNIMELEKPNKEN